MIEAARLKMIPRLKEIWKNCFHDEDEYIDFYYRERFPQVETLVNTVNGVPAAMVTLVPGKLAAGDTTYQLRYVYAVATDPVYQGRGLASELMNEIKKRVGNEYDAVFLVPASQGLFDYYAKFGYKTVCEKKVVSIGVNEVVDETLDSENSRSSCEEECSQEIQFESLSASDLYQMREQAFRMLGFVEWDIQALDYLIREYELCGGKAVKVKMGNEAGSLFYYYSIEHKVLYIKETSLGLNQLKLVMKKLAKDFEIEHFEVIIPATSKPNGISTPFVMAYGEGISHLQYANFVKD
ncbi:MAG: GNAT family N-acetyltransferase [Clostridiales bacterium]|nr:GNAT family N-acetyltransferase [Clostridiales bacterium]